MAIIEALCERRYEKRENLAYEFGVCTRTIDYDICFLSIRFPIYTVRGYGGGVFIVDGYRLGKKYLTEKQVEILERLCLIFTGEILEVLKSIINDFKMPEIKDNKKRV